VQTNLDAHARGDADEAPCLSFLVALEVVRGLSWEISRHK
jgi:hypothetical protein